MSRAAYVVTVFGRPAPQGSKKLVGPHRMIEVSKYVKPWRKAVVDACLEQGVPDKPIDGALQLHIVFSIDKGASVRRPRPSVAPDLSKLIRSTEDALTTAGVWKDDARIVSMRVDEFYAGSGGLYVLPQSGAVIAVHVIDPHF